MKLIIAIANIAAVTPLMLKKGSGEGATQVPAKSLTIKGDVAPELLNELRDGLADKFFEPATKEGAPRVPCIPELAGPMGWKTEYEGGTLELDLSQLEDLDFEDEELTLTGVSAEGITFEPLPTGMVSLKVNAVLETDDAELRGKLDGLLRHTVRASFSKLTQQPLAVPKSAKDDAAQSTQGELIES